MRFGVDRRAFEPVHVHVAAGAPVLAGDVAQSGAYQDQGRVSVGEGADDSCSAAHFADHPFEGIIGPEVAPVLGREGKVAEGLRRVETHVLGGHRQLHFSELRHDLPGLFLGGRAVFAGVDRLEHLGGDAHLGRGHERPDVAVKVNDTALVRRFGIKLGDRLHQPQAAVADDQFDALEPVMSSTRRTETPA